MERQTSAKIDAQEQNEIGLNNTHSEILDQSKEEDSESINIDLFSECLLLKIVSLLDIPSLLELSLVNKHFNALVHDHTIWSEKINYHFKNDFLVITNPSYHLFIELYNTTERLLPKKTKKLILLLREGNFAFFKALFKPKDLIDCPHLALKIIKLKDQKVFDLIYSLMTAFYHDKSRANFRFSLVSTGYTEVSLLHWAALLNQPPEVVEQLILEGGDINQEIDWYGRPVEIAIENDNYGVIQVFLEAKVNYASVTEFSTTTILGKAITRCTFNSIQLIYNYIFIESPDLAINQLDWWLYLAAQEEKQQAVQFFLNEGANPNNMDHGVTPLYLACRNGDIDMVKNLIQHRADVNLFCGWQANYKSPLIGAAQHSHEQILLLLLQHGANINAASHDKNTALHRLIMQGNIKMVSFLLQHKADPNKRNEKNRTALLLATIYGHVEIVRLLLAVKVNINDAGNYQLNMTALHLAAEKNKLGIAQALLNAGANILLKSNGKTALDIAKKEKNEAMYDLLRPYFVSATFIQKNGKSNLANLSLLNQKKAGDTPAQQVAKLRADIRPF